jgi:hypothetical protein
VKIPFWVELRKISASSQTGPVSCGFMFFEAKNIKASAATRLERDLFGFS